MNTYVTYKETKNLKKVHRSHTVNSQFHKISLEVRHKGSLI